MEKSNQIKYIGFVIDIYLNFKISHPLFLQRMRKKINFFKRSRKLLITLTSITIGIIKPHFDFRKICYPTMNKSTNLYIA